MWPSSSSVYGPSRVLGPNRRRSSREYRLEDPSPRVELSRDIEQMGCPTID